MTECFDRIPYPPPLSLPDSPAAPDPIHYRTRCEYRAVHVKYTLDVMRYTKAAMRLEMDHRKREMQWLYGLSKLFLNLQPGLQRDLFLPPSGLIWRYWCLSEKDDGYRILAVIKRRYKRP